LGSVVGAGVLQDLLRPPLLSGDPFIINECSSQPMGLPFIGAIGLFILIAAFFTFWAHKGNAIRSGINRLSPKRRSALKSTTFLLFFIILLALPQILGLFLSEVLTIVDCMSSWAWG